MPSGQTSKPLRSKAESKPATGAELNSVALSFVSSPLCDAMCAACVAAKSLKAKTGVRESVLHGSFSVKVISASFKSRTAERGSDCLLFPVTLKGANFGTAASRSLPLMASGMFLSPSCDCSVLSYNVSASFFCFFKPCPAPTDYLKH